MPRLVGGPSNAKEATPEIQIVIDGIKSVVEEKLQKSFDVFEAKLFSTQVVAGVNYFVKVHTGQGSFLHLRIYKDLKGTVSLHGVQEEKTEVDALEYF